MSSSDPATFLSRLMWSTSLSLTRGRRNALSEPFFGFQPNRLRDPKNSPHTCPTTSSTDSPISKVSGKLRASEVAATINLLYSLSQSI